VHNAALENGLPLPPETVFSRPLIVVFVALFGAMTSFFLLASAVPLYAATIGGSATSAGFSTGVLLLAAVGAELAAPTVIAHWGRRRVVVASFILLGAPALFFGVTTHNAVLIALCAIRGAGFGVLAVAGGTLVVTLAHPDHRGRVLAVYGLVATIPAVFALPLGVWLSGHIGFTALFVAGGLAAIAGTACAFCISNEESHGASVLSVSEGIAQSKLIWPAVAFTATAMAAGVITTFLPLLTATFRPGTAAWGLLIQALMAMLTRWLAGRYSHQFPGFRLLGPGVVLASGGILVLATSTGFLSVAIAMVLFGAGFGVAQNASLILMLNQVDAGGYDTVNALWNLAYDLGWAAGASGFGLLASQYGYPAALATSGVAMLMMLSMAWRRGASSWATSARGSRATGIADQSAEQT
jgi:predicted MFS family arabinose efflux permease